MKLKVWRDPDGLYLLKGGSPDVWRLFRIKKKWREAQGIIHGKRSGTSQGLGPAARLRALIGQGIKHLTEHAGAIAATSGALLAISVLNCEVVTWFYRGGLRLVEHHETPLPEITYAKSNIKRSPSRSHPQ